ncbi:MAG TPA: hypothetical protein VGN00_19235 [Puia sp.]|jgi:hypothetical protein
MKKIINLAVCTLAMAGLLLSCKKEGGTPVVSSSLTIVNALWQGDTLVTNFNPDPGSKADSFSYGTAGYIVPGNYSEFPAYIGLTHLALSQIDDTANTVYNGSFNIAAGTINSLFIGGTAASPDSLFTTDQVPVIRDSAIGVRFVNLCTGNMPVSIGIAGGNTLTGSLAYKGVTNFQLLPVSSASPAGSAYTFEFRDVATSAVLTTRSIVAIVPGSVSIYSKSVTLVLYGPADSARTILVNNY